MEKGICGGNLRGPWKGMWGSKGPERLRGDEKKKAKI